MTDVEAGRDVQILKRRADSGDCDAQYQYACAMELQDNRAEAIKYLKLAADQGNKDARRAYNLLIVKLRMQAPEESHMLTYP